MLLLDEKSGTVLQYHLVCIIQVWLYLSLFTYLCVNVFSHLSLFLSLSMYLLLCLGFSLSFSLCLSLSLFLSIYFSPSWGTCVSHPVLRAVLDHWGISPAAFSQCLRHRGCGQLGLLGSRHSLSRFDPYYSGSHYPTQPKHPSSQVFSKHLAILIRIHSQLKWKKKHIMVEWCSLGILGGNYVL